jgi:hypothetical protein
MIIAPLAVLGVDLIVIAVILAGSWAGAGGCTRPDAFRVRYGSPAAVSTGSRPSGIGATAAEFATSWWAPAPFLLRAELVSCRN